MRVASCHFYHRAVDSYNPRRTVILIGFQTGSETDLVEYLNELSQRRFLSDLLAWLSHARSHFIAQALG
jgi:hypothetical protein